MFNQAHIQEFKEAFGMIAPNRGGLIDTEDLADMLASLGKNPTEAYVDEMMNAAPGPINFTMFLAVFGNKLNDTDPEDVTKDAFACFDKEGKVFIQEDRLRQLLTTKVDRFADEEVYQMFGEAQIKRGKFDCL